MKKTTIIYGALGIFLLAACGGGSGSSEPAEPCTQIFIDDFNLANTQCSKKRANPENLPSDIFSLEVMEASLTKCVRVWSNFQDNHQNLECRASLVASSEEVTVTNGMIDFDYLTPAKDNLAKVESELEILRKNESRFSEIGSIMPDFPDSYPRCSSTLTEELLPRLSSDCREIVDHEQSIRCESLSKRIDRMLIVEDCQTGKLFPLIGLMGDESPLVTKVRVSKFYENSQKNFNLYYSYRNDGEKCGFYVERDIDRVKKICGNNPQTFKCDGEVDELSSKYSGIDCRDTRWNRYSDETLRDMVQGSKKKKNKRVLRESQIKDKSLPYVAYVVDNRSGFTCQEYRTNSQRLYKSFREGWEVQGFKEVSSCQSEDFPYSCIYPKEDSLIGDSAQHQTILHLNLKEGAIGSTKEACNKVNGTFKKAH